MSKGNGKPGVSELHRDRRGRVQYPDVALTFATLVTFAGVGAFAWKAIQVAIPAVDPLSAVLLRLAISVLAVGIVVGLAVSATTN